ncbi:hypothetical protein QBC42DRAFT_267274 [Cladorrhinum samala]|uniref:Uncharacterized protein n=1 Tax=Cladorrhinum samala TaxID=585594 RepID=A0AAV9HPJ0_9PEZI|nr:hypothetical protein QBC42DRAFT_267274 [Cladorrhinum samala]
MINTPFLFFSFPFLIELLLSKFLFGNREKKKSLSSERATMVRYLYPFLLFWKTVTEFSLRDLVARFSFKGVPSHVDDFVFVWWDSGLAERKERI